MAQINASINLMNGMTQPLMNIVNSVNSVISTLQAVNKTNVNIDTSSLKYSQDLLNQTSANLIRHQEELENQFNKNAEAAGKVNEKLKEGINPMDDLIRKAKRLALTFGGIKMLNISDEITGMNARVNIMAREGEDPEQIKQMIFESAQRSRANYFDTANSAATMGITAKDTFRSSKEVIDFSELANKQFEIAGIKGAAKEGAMIQLQQAMSMGVLRGQEFRSVQQGMPTMIDYLAKHLGKTKTQIKEMADQGKLTASIVKAAMFGAADDINKKFESIPMTFGAVATRISNVFIKEFEGVSQQLGKIVNGNDFTTVMNTVASGVRIGVWALSGLVSGVSGVINTIKELKVVVIPVLGMLTAQFLAVKAAALISSVATAIASGTMAKHTIITVGATFATSLYSAATAIGTIATGIMTGSIGLLSTGFAGLTAAIMACPIMWLVGAIILVVMGINHWVKKTNELQGTTYTTMGVIVGAFLAGTAAILNTMKYLVNNVYHSVALMWNTFATFAESLVEFFFDPINSVKIMFTGMAKIILDSLYNVSSVLDKIFNTDVSGKIKDVRNIINDYADNNIKDPTLKIARMNQTKNILEYSGIEETFKKGMNIGDGISEKISGVMNTIAGNTSSIAKNTEKTNSTLDLTKEELKYLRDVAEQEVINRYTTASINNNNTFNNNINSEMDVDGVVSKFYNGLAEAASTVAEGV